VIRKLIVVAVAAGVLAVPLGAQARVRIVRVPSSISIVEAKGGFVGRVTSPARRCLGNRFVNIYLANPGGSPTLAGNVTTSPRGRWAATPAGFVIKGQHYFARVLRTRLAHTVCRPAQSPTITA
jgi:hypothetical protein